MVLAFKIDVVLAWFDSRFGVEYWRGVGVICDWFWRCILMQFWRGFESGFGVTKEAQEDYQYPCTHPYKHSLFIRSLIIPH